MDISFIELIEDTIIAASIMADVAQELGMEYKL